MCKDLMTPKIFYYNFWQIIETNNQLNDYVSDLRIYDFHRYPQSLKQIYGFIKN